MVDTATAISFSALPATFAIPLATPASTESSEIFDNLSVVFRSVSINNKLPFDMCTWLDIYAHYATCLFFSIGSLAIIL
jgi:hypothetical protein